MILVFIGISYAKYQEIENWVKYHSLNLIDIKAKGSFSDDSFFSNYFKEQYYIHIISQSGEKGIILFQFGFRNFTNPNKIWLSRPLHDKKDDVIKNDINF